MKIAVISFSGNVGKTTIVRHLLAPRVPDCKVIAIESINAGDTQDHVIRGKHFSELQEYLQVVKDVVVDVGASNVEELLGLMRRYDGSHEDFDFFVVPTVPALKQQQDTIATLAELHALGVPQDKVRLVFNMVEDGSEVERTFDSVLDFARMSGFTQISTECRLEINEIYSRLNATQPSLSATAADTVDYKALIASATDSAERLSLAQRLATRRLARGVLSEIDACFSALRLRHASADATRAC